MQGHVAFDILTGPCHTSARWAWICAWAPRRVPGSCFMAVMRVGRCTRPLVKSAPIPRGSHSPLAFRKN
eukprot:10505111-Alexandrium_andersonii.AAC.1